SLVNPNWIVGRAEHAMETAFGLGRSGFHRLELPLCVAPDGRHDRRLFRDRLPLRVSRRGKLPRKRGYRIIARTNWPRTLLAVSGKGLSLCWKSGSSALLR